MTCATECAHINRFDTTLERDGRTFFTLWKGRFGLGVTWISVIFWLAKGEYVMTVSGLSPDTNLLTRSDFSDGFSAVFLYLAAPKSLSQMVDTETSIFAGSFTSVSGENSASSQVSTSGIAAELRYLWPKDVGSGRFRATYFTVTCHYGRRNRLTGRQRGRWLAWQVNTTFGTCWNGFCGFLGHFYRHQSARNRLRMTITTAIISRENSNLPSNLWLYRNGERSRGRRRGSGEGGVSRFARIRCQILTSYISVTVRRIYKLYI